MRRKQKMPARMCVACREMKDKREMIRVVKSPEGTVGLDERGKAPGRGAYLCRKVECLARAQKAHSLEKALQCRISESLYAELKEKMQESAETNEG